MKKLLALSVAMALSVSVARAGDLKSGPQTGEGVGAYQVTKVAGAESEGVKDGSNLCYRCRMGSRPVVMVFARSADKSLAQLTKELDQVVAKNSDKKLASFVNLLGKDEDALKKQAAEFVNGNKLENVAFVVPHDQPNGPGSYKINPEADVTVLIYREGKVVVNHTLAAGKLNDGAIKQIVADTAKILN